MVSKIGTRDLTLKKSRPRIRGRKIRTEGEERGGTGRGETGERKKGRWEGGKERGRKETNE